MPDIPKIDCPWCGRPMEHGVYGPAITWMAGCAFYRCAACGMLIAKHGVRSYTELARLVNSMGDLAIKGYHVAAVGCPVCGEWIHLSWNPGDEFKTVVCSGCDSEWPMGWLQDKAIESDEKKEKDLDALDCSRVSDSGGAGDAGAGGARRS